MSPVSKEPDRLCYSIAQAARVSSLGRSTVYRAIKAGRLAVVKVGGRTLVPAASLHRLLSGEAA